MAGIGKQRPVRGDEMLDAVGRGVKAARDGGDLVIAGDRNAQAELAAAPCSDAVPQALQPARQMAHDRIGGSPDHRGNHGEIGEGAAPAGTEGNFQPGRDTAAIVETGDDRPVAPARRLEDIGGKGFTGAGDEPAIRRVDADIGVEGIREPRYHGAQAWRDRRRAETCRR